MKAENCPREVEVLEATRSGDWPEELRSHLAECSVCADVSSVAEVLLQAEAQLGSPPPLPSAGFVWWKAQLRARREAVQRAAEPIAIVERLAWGCGLLALLGLAFWQWARVEDWWRWLTGLPYLSDLRLARLIFHDGSGLDGVGLGGPTLALLLSLCAGVAVISLLLYVVLEEE